jgi:hypothetical protein
MEQIKCYCGHTTYCDCGPLPKQTLKEAAEKWVFETNGHKWSNNDDTAGDNYGSFKAGAKWMSEYRGYSEEDVRKAYQQGEEDSYLKGGQTKEMENEFIQSLHQFKSK